MQTTDEHRLCWAMLRAALQISSAECDQLLQRAPGWCERWESGEAPAVSLQQWQLDVCALAHWHGSAVIASAEPAVLLQMAELMKQHASRLMVERTLESGFADLIEE